MEYSKSQRKRLGNEDVNNNDYLHGNFFPLSLGQFFVMVRISKYNRQSQEGVFSLIFGIENP